MVAGPPEGREPPTVEVSAGIFVACDLIDDVLLISVPVITQVLYDARSRVA